MRCGGVFHDAARVVELEHRAVAPDGGRGVLLAPAHGLHPLIGEGRIRAGACAAGAVRAGHAAEPLSVAVVAGEDAVEGHEFEIVLMRADAEMRDARQRGGGREAVGDEDFSGGVVELHGSRKPKIKLRALSS